MSGALTLAGERLQLSPEQRAVLLRVAVLGLLGLALSLASDAFLGGSNLLNVLRQASLMFLLASGVTLVILCGGLDLSIGANVALSACLAATAMKAGGSVLLGTVLTQFTNWGQEVYATGANTEAAALSGVPVNRRRIAVYALSGLMGGLAALVYLARLNSAEGDMGESLTLQAIAAVLIGGTSLFGGTGTLAGTMVGALILTVVLNGMNLLGVSANWQPLITGVIVILSVLSDAVARRRQGV